MDQMPSTSCNQRQIDLNNNKNDNCNKSPLQALNKCSCTNISIMQLFHEMKQEFPKVPDNIVQQLVTENCHNKKACVEKLQKIVASSLTSTTSMYPSKLIHNNDGNSNCNSQTQKNSNLNGSKWSNNIINSNNQRMKEITEKFENTSISSSSSSSSEATAASDNKIKRPTTLPLRRAPDPPCTSSSITSTPSSTTSISSFSSSSYQHQQHPQDDQILHNIQFDSKASKVNDSLCMQVDLKVSPVSTKRPAPPPPIKPRFVSHLSVQPEPSYTKILDSKKSPISSVLQQPGATTFGACTAGQKSFTNVTLRLRQPSSASTPPPQQDTIDIFAGPQAFTYTSTSFNAKDNSKNHVKITVENGESSIQTLRMAKNVPENSQFDTTINIEGKYVMNDEMDAYTIVSSPYQRPLTLHSDNNYLSDDELRQLIGRQTKQKESLESELEKEREKLQMIRLDIITLTSSTMTQTELKELYDEITRLRSLCERLTDENDIAAMPQRSRTATGSSNSSNSPAPPPIPRGLVSKKGSHSPSNSQLPQLDTTGFRYPPSPLSTSTSSLPPPSYNQVMQESSSIQETSDWICNICTFLNNGFLNACEACDMPRVHGITITSSSYRPLYQNNQLQGASVPTNDNNDNINSNNNHNKSNNNVIQTTVL